MATQLKIRSILKETIPDAPEWLDKLLVPLNDVILSTSLALNNGITFSENMSCQLKTLQFTTPAKWHTVGAAGEAVNFENSWGNYNTSTHESAAYRKEGGIVYVKGIVTGGVMNDTVFTLPEAYRAAYTNDFGTTSNHAFGSFRVSSSGSVTPAAGDVAWFALNCAFQAADASSPIEAPFPINFKSTLAGRASGCVCLAAIPTNQNSTSATSATPGALSVDFADLGNGQITVKQIYGLLPSTPYTVLLLLTTK